MVSTESQFHCLKIIIIIIIASRDDDDDDDDFNDNIQVREMMSEEI